ncbi:MAG: CoA-binding protein [candidate division KSB1 bacterium]|nr:CoA-binding protein [candidate division KSB1 bacterium]MDZ7304172.1 CoA-binding protein [candidate division KSB1 bacterium]MDZ7310644.1 CoA-binding protein [candidate division KSB1 bacterium]
MTTKSAIEDFVAQRKLAVVGVSRNGKKFGNAAFRALKEKGYCLFPINPNAERIEGDRCYPNLESLPETVDGVLIVVPPAETERVVREAAAAGIRRVWMQQGAESEAAIRFCQANGISAIHGECILMFAQPVVSFHRFHRWVWKVLGKLPR